MYATNQRNWSLELYRRIGAMVPSMTGKIWIAVMWEMFLLCLGDIKKERADEFMFDENFDPSTLDGFGLKWTYHRDRF